MTFARLFAAQLCVWVTFLHCPSLPPISSHGSGFGFAVVSPRGCNGASKFYAHPYSFVRPDSKNPLSEGIETANFIKKPRLRRSPSPHNASATYEQDSHIIRARLERRRRLSSSCHSACGKHALIICWEPAADSPGHQKASASSGTKPVKSQTSVRIAGVGNRTAQVRGHRRIPASHPAHARRRTHPQSPSSHWPTAPHGPLSLHRKPTTSSRRPSKNSSQWRAGLAP